MTELAVLVPVLNRPRNVAPLVESFLAGCPEDSAICFLTNVDDTDEINAVLQVVDDDRVYISSTERVTWPEKINYGVWYLHADWYLLAADDIRFTPGWWDATARLRKNKRISVIGTNDLGNPRVAAGQLVIHPLVRGTYIRDYGTIDEPGKVVHDGYHHWCCDDELLWTAKSRDAFVYCADAVIEHLHPYWGKGEMDATYAKGEANAEADMALWRERAKLLGLEMR
jgi:glycosyltransferase involved in cell wall biosynthesis